MTPINFWEYDGSLEEWADYANKLAPLPAVESELAARREAWAQRRARLDALLKAYEGLSSEAQP